MNSLVVYFSKFGNTREIADEIAEILRSAGEGSLSSNNKV